MANKRKVGPGGTFAASLRMALDHVGDDGWLGGNSPLATPYFLGAYLDVAHGALAPAAGQALQQALEETATELWPGELPASRQELEEAVDAERLDQGHKGPRYQYLLLELRFFRRYFSPRTFPVQVKHIPDFLNVSQTRYYEHLNAAIGSLGQLLLRRFRPTLRLEQPPVRGTLIGRSDVEQAILTDLKAGRDVAISGVGGVGKSSLGASIRAGWPTELTFWYTFRPGLNDDLDSLLFGLGHFLQRWARSALWLQLLVNKGEPVAPETAAGYLREDLRAVASLRPLLCFDEVDLLQATGDSPRKGRHIQLLEFLDSLRGQAPLLLIGQRALLDTANHYSLQPLSPAQTTQLLQAHEVLLDFSQQQRLHRYTRGVPRLLELFIALWHSGDDAADLLLLPRSAAAKPLFHRLWKRLNEQERRLLGALAVFRAAAPADAWRAEGVALDSLAKRQLVKSDLGGGIILLPLVRDLVYEALPAEVLRQRHQEAALIRLSRGEYTPAAYHFRHAGDVRSAVQTWYAHQDKEIQRGYSGAAREIFGDLPAASVEGRSRTRLRLIQNRLNLLAGQAEAVLAGMDQFSWLPDDEETAEAYEQWGLAYANLGEDEAAALRYEHALETVSRLTERAIRLWYRHSQMNMRATDFEGARPATPPRPAIKLNACGDSSLSKQMIWRQPRPVSMPPSPWPRRWTTTAGWR